MNLATVTFIVLLVIKLLGLASISWWWVFSPLIITAILVLLIVINER